MLEEYDTWSQVLNQNFEVRSTNNVSCLIERVADMLIKQLPRENAYVSSDYSSAAEFRTMITESFLGITESFLGNQANEHSEATLPRKFLSSHSIIVESVQHERLCSLGSVV